MARLAALRVGVLDPEQEAGETRIPWYRQLGGIVAASPVVGASDRERLLRLLDAAGIRAHGRLASVVAAKLCAAVALAALVWLWLESYQLLLGMSDSSMAPAFCRVLARLAAAGLRAGPDCRAAAAAARKRHARRARSARRLRRGRAEPQPGDRRGQPRAARVELGRRRGICADRRRNARAGRCRSRHRQHGAAHRPRQPEPASWRP